jgi:hypothetical protein
LLCAPAASRRFSLRDRFRKGKGFLIHASIITQIAACCLWRSFGREQSAERAFLMLCSVLFQERKVPV